METIRTKLEELKSVDIRTVDRDSLVDIRDVKIEETLPREERLLNFFEQIQNPYCYRCGKAVVKVSFASTDGTLEEKLEQFLKT